MSDSASAGGVPSNAGGCNFWYTFFSRDNNSEHISEQLIEAWKIPGEVHVVAASTFTGTASNESSLDTEDVPPSSSWEQLDTPTTSPIQNLADTLSAQSSLNGFQQFTLKTLKSKRIFFFVLALNVYFISLCFIRPSTPAFASFTSVNVTENLPMPDNVTPDELILARTNIRELFKQRQHVVDYVSINAISSEIVERVEKEYAQAKKEQRAVSPFCNVPFFYVFHPVCGVPPFDAEAFVMGMSIA
jgi:hypothetical protein